MNIKRGDIFYADLSPVIGSEQGGIRPVVIVQNDMGNKFSPTVNELKSLNNLTSNNLSVGQILLLPSDNNTYTVKSGDSLWNIANRYGTTVNELKALNKTAVFWPPFCYGFCKGLKIQ